MEHRTAHLLVLWALCAEGRSQRIDDVDAAFLFKGNKLALKNEFAGEVIRGTVGGFTPPVTDRERFQPASDAIEFGPPGSFGYYEGKIHGNSGPHSSYPPHHGHQQPDHGGYSIPTYSPYKPTYQPAEHHRARHNDEPHHDRYGQQYHERPQYGYKAGEALSTTSHLERIPKTCRENLSGSKIGFKLNPDRLSPVDECNAATVAFLRDSCTQNPRFTKSSGRSQPMLRRRLEEDEEEYDSNRYDESGEEEEYDSYRYDENRDYESAGHGTERKFCRYEPYYQAQTGFKDGKFIVPTDTDLLLVKHSFCYNAFFRARSGDVIYPPGLIESHGQSDKCTDGPGERIWWVTACRCTDKPAKRACKNCPSLN